MARRSRRVGEPPSGLSYRTGLLSPAEEAVLVSRLSRLELTHPVMHATPARRLTVHFGWSYDLEGGALVPGPAIPDTLLDLRRRAGELSGEDPEVLVEILVTRYPPGAGIGWHRDAPAFGTPVVGVSLLSACRLRLRRPRGEGYDLFELELAPRSGYVLRGAARWQWQHHIPELERERWSVTFRTLRRPRERAGLPRSSPEPAPGAWLAGVRQPPGQ